MNQIDENIYKDLKRKITDPKDYVKDTIPIALKRHNLSSLNLAIQYIGHSMCTKPDILLYLTFLRHEITKHKPSGELDYTKFEFERYDSSISCDDRTIGDMLELENDKITYRSIANAINIMMSSYCWENYEIVSRVTHEIARRAEGVHTYECGTLENIISYNMVIDKLRDQVDILQMDDDDDIISELLTPTTYDDEGNVLMTKFDEFNHVLNLIATVIKYVESDLGMINKYCKEKNIPKWNNTKRIKTDLKIYWNEYDEKNQSTSGGGYVRWVEGTKIIPTIIPVPNDVDKDHVAAICTMNPNVKDITFRRYDNYNCNLKFNEY